jgi:hypothetical protein
MSYNAAPPPVYPASPSSGQQTQPMAIVSLIFGILGLVGVCPGLGSIIGLITGYMARSTIRQDPARYSGDGLATGGIVLGWIGVALMACGLCSALVWLFFMGGMAIIGAATQSHSLLPLLTALFA